ncbi:N-acetylmuramoyl-L-alanine amidase [Proteiniclasticum sp. SCR006]|uniref:N-acetylmuramoyl-L-alanine amidase n=1 Tax=Proteiniclasticum aestuarii TaxID=2817862 RepID=A0A939H674_9CLOT|nr:N-acetylmuramoyl-L-alanine amidase [Proteiniclasticum aestuarii]MBO1264939.1 N-acetylmuramoyl-L-alanine amidase [Proteiniclasticum aestuarii]
MNGMRKVTAILLLFAGILALSGCKSDNRELLNKKIAEGELLLAEERFEEASAYFAELFDANRDSLTVMEKHEFSINMVKSRENLQEAERLMKTEAFRSAYEQLKEIHPEDLGGQERREDLEKEIRDSYLSNVQKLSEEKKYEEALSVLDEYQDMVGSQEELEVLRSSLLADLIAWENPEKPEPVKKIVVLDPGHQAVQDKEKEPLGPGSEILKNRVSSGTRGVATGVYEYELNLLFSLKLRDRLLEEGFEVLLTRTAHDVSISNKERAEMANEAGADVFIRIHANGSENRDKQGIMTIHPSKDNPFVGHLSEESYRLSRDLHDEMVSGTEGKSAGIQAMDNMVGINWSKVPVSIVELGYMSNEEEDLLLQTEAYQAKLVEGLVRGIQKYFEQYKE